MWRRGLPTTPARVRCSSASRRARPLRASMRLPLSLSETSPSREFPDRSGCTGLCVPEICWCTALIASMPAMPVDPAPLNSVGDLVLDDARAMRALSDPLRLTLFDLVRREGPVASEALARRTDRDQATVDNHLRDLESVGFVEKAVSEHGEVRWTTEAKGIYFEIPDEPAGQLAARQLSTVMMTKYAELPASWAGSEEPK